MLHLMLLRHAKSSWDSPDLSDHERQLTKRGIKAATRIGRYIAENHLTPDLILCSDAIRARATLALVLAKLEPASPDVIISDDLYLANPDQIQQTIRDNSGEARRILVVGHNPGLHALALSLLMDSKDNSMTELAKKYSTAALAHLTFGVSAWSDIRPAIGHLDRYITPRGLVD